jgi:hypothetical protein
MTPAISGERDTALPESEQELNRLIDNTVEITIKVFIEIPTGFSQTMRYLPKCVDIVPKCTLNI